MYWLIFFYEFVAGQREVLQSTKDVYVSQLLSAAHVEMNNLEQQPEPTSTNRGDSAAAAEDTME